MTSPRLDQAPLDPGPPPTPPSGAPRRSRSDAFFSWTAGLGIVRADGWLGGVAAGIAARLRIDPLIVRGILVVVALFGFPALFLYGLAWALLPDLDGRIPLRDAMRGQGTPALGGAAACALIGLVPAPLSVVLGTPALAGLAPSTTIGTLLAVVVGLLVVGALVFVIVRAAAHSPRASAPAAPVPDERTASAASEAPDTSATASGSGPDAVEADLEGADADGFAASAPSPSHEGPDAAYDAWREQHAAWKVQDDAWRRQQQDAARVAREQARRERQARATEFAADAAERRRIRRFTKPRTPFAFVAAAIGLAIVVGAVAGLRSPGLLAPAVGLFAAALVVALAMVVAGVLRRRSGFLAFVTILLLAGGATATTVPTLQSLHVGGYGISNIDTSTSYPASRPFVQLWGDVSIYLAATGAPTEAIHVHKRSGGTMVTVEPDVTLHLDVTAPPWATILQRPDGDAVELREAMDAEVTTMPDGRLRYVGTIAATGAGTPTEQTLVIDQQSGWIQIQLLAPAEVSE